MDDRKPIKEWSYDELLGWCRGHVLVGIGNGDFRESVNDCVNTVLMWQQAMDEKIAKRKKK